MESPGPSPARSSIFEVSGRALRLWPVVLVGVLMAALVGAGVLAIVRRSGPVSIVEPSPPNAEAARVCADLVRALPEVVDGHDERATDPTSQFVRAWGRPAIVLFCGVGVPAEFTPTSELVGVNDVDWLPVEEEPAWRFTTIGRIVNVQVLVPKEYEQPVNPLIDLAPLIRMNVPLAR